MFGLTTLDLNGSQKPNSNYEERKSIIKEYLAEKTKSLKNCKYQH